MTLTTTVDHQHADGHTLRLTFAELPVLVEIAGRLTSPWLGMYGDAGDEAGGAEIEQLAYGYSA